MCCPSLGVPLYARPVLIFSDNTRVVWCGFTSRRIKQGCHFLGSCVEFVTVARQIASHEHATGLPICPSSRRGSRLSFCGHADEHKSKVTPQHTIKVAAAIMRLQVFRAIWGVINKTDGRLARSPVQTFSQAVRRIKRLGCNCNLALKLSLTAAT